MWITLVACFIECFLFYGCIFGWASLAFLLQRDGIFIQLCPNVTHNLTSDVEENATEVPKDLDIGCDEQRSAVALAFTFATIILGLLTFPNGIIFDKYGLRVTRCLAT